MFAFSYSESAMICTVSKFGNNYTFTFKNLTYSFYSRAEFDARTKLDFSAL